MQSLEEDGGLSYNCRFKEIMLTGMLEEKYYDAVDNVFPFYTSLHTGIGENLMKPVLWIYSLDTLKLSD